MSQACWGAHMALEFRLDVIADNCARNAVAEINTQCSLNEGLTKDGNKPL